MLTATYSGFKGSETNSVLSTQPTLSTSANQDSNVGNYTITISGATAINYTITHTAGQLTITQRMMKDNTVDYASVTVTPDHFDADGSAHEPSITIVDASDGNRTLTLTADYTIGKTGTYVNVGSPDFTAPDIYNFIITFTGNYTGTKTVKYQIRPEVLLNNSAYRWRTFYESTYNMKVPTGASGFQAYTVSDVNVYAVEVTDRQYIKAGVPMLLYKPGANYQFYPELVEPTDGHLSGWSASGYYKQNASDWDLGTDSNILNETKKVWVLVRDKFVRSMSGTLKANKCYLELSGSTPVSFSPELNLNPILTGIETPIESRNDKRVVSEWYTLDGRKIQGIPSKKGIYITNGKKIIIK